MTDTSYQLLFTYTNQCKGLNPIEDIENIKDKVQEYIDDIWRQISKIDSIGRAEVIRKCGGGDHTFTEMLAGARDLAKLLTTIRRSLSSIEESIGCDSVSRLYNRVAHVIICTETLSASAYGFITFLLMWVCLMVMISLPASWLSNIQEEKVYHDETEVAENMVLDEHEEYLAYISRYKHEWQEYEGFEEEAAVNTACENEYAHELELAEERYDGDGDSDYYHSDEEFDSDVANSDLGSTESRQEQTVVSCQNTSADIDEAVSYESGDISFASFSTEQNEGTRSHNDVGEKTSLPLTILSPQLPPPINPEFYIQPDLDQNMSFHHFQPTGEVEVQLCNK